MSSHVTTAVERTVIEKTCVLCGEEKPASDFRRNHRMRLGLDSYCRPCAAAKSAAWRAAHPERTRELEQLRPKRTTEERWAVMLWVHYRMTPAEYWALHADQGGVCAICLEPERGKRGMLHVDHCHETGSVRGLLCQQCNLALGHFRDNPDLMTSAVHYLAQSKETS